VLAVFEGDPDGVRRMVEWCRTGPPTARVESVDVVEEEPTRASGFSVR
jgi:acylphosphatase